MDIYQSEETDGVRMPWNVLPLNRNWADKIVLPVGVHYTPGKAIQDMEFLGDQPVLCIGCKAALNPFSKLDMNTKSYLCPLCGARGSLPQSKIKYLMEYQTLPELAPTSTTIEYLLDEQHRERGYLFIVDKCIPADEMVEIKESIKSQSATLADDCFVGLITFDRNVFVQDLHEMEFLSEYAFNGSKDYPMAKIASMLQFILPPNDAVNFKPSANHSLVFNKLENCRELFERAVDKITTDKWYTSATERPARAAGAALKIAMTMATGWFQHGMQIIMCLGGPCTYGPGLIIPQNKEIFPRSHDDLVEDSEKIATHKKAKEFYDSLLVSARKCNSSVALFAFSCDQFGFAEMRDLITKTGGFCASHELFHSNVFKDSIKNFFNHNEYQYIDKCFGGKMEVLLSKGFKVQGMVGCCLSEGVKSNKVSDVPVGESGTTSWYLGTFDKNSTYSLVLESDKLDDVSLQNQPFTLQFKTYFKDGYGQMKLRVTTIQRKFGNISKEAYASGFDQEAAIILTARCALALSGLMDQKEITKWIDKRLIKLYSRFGEFTRLVSSSFRIHESFELVPQFFYYLRKSTFVLNFAISVDEMHYNRMILTRENLSNCLVMIQPSILEYNCDNSDPQAVICDISVMKDDVVILFDAYFNVVIWHGGSIKQWRDEGYHEDPEYASLKAALENPVEDSKVN